MTLEIKLLFPGAEQEIYLEHVDAAIKAIISKSFLPYQKGEARKS